MPHSGRMSCFSLGSWEDYLILFGCVKCLGEVSESVSSGKSGISCCEGCHKALCIGLRCAKLLNFFEVVDKESHIVGRAGKAMTPYE